MLFIEVVLKKRIATVAAEKHGVDMDTLWDKMANPKDFDSWGDVAKAAEELAKGESKDKDESISINGQKYKPIKESQKHPLKEIYDRTFRSLK